jgi:hypothetical protein
MVRAIVSGFGGTGEAVALASFTLTTVGPADPANVTFHSGFFSVGHSIDDNRPPLACDVAAASA